MVRRCMNVRGWRDEGTPPAGEEYLIFPLRVRPMDRPLRRRGELAGEFGGEATCVVARLWPLGRSVGGRAYTCMCSLPFCISGSDSTRGHPSVFGGLFILTRRWHLHLPSSEQQQILPPPPPQNILPFLAFTSFPSPKFARSASQSRRRGSPTSPMCRERGFLWRSRPENLSLSLKVIIT